MSDQREDERVAARDAAPAATDPAAEPFRGAIVEPPESHTTEPAPPSVEPTASEESAVPDDAEGIPAPDAPGPESEATPATVAGDDRESFFTRLRAAFRGFFRGLQGLPVEIPPGEEGTIPIAKANIIQRRLEKRLAKAQAKNEDLRAQLEQNKQEIAERDASLKDAQKETKRVRSEAVGAEASLRKEAEKALDTVREKDERIERLQNEVSGRDARLAQRDADLEKQRLEFEDARRAATEKERELNLLLDDTRRQLDDRSGELARTEEARVKFESERDAALARGEEMGRELDQLRREVAARDDTIAALRTEMNTAAEQAKTDLDDAVGDLQFTKSTLMEKESALQLLLGEVKNQEQEADRERAEWTQQQEQLRGEIEEGKKKLGEAQTATEKIRAELVAALPDRAEFDRVRAKAGQLERELARKNEEADLLREDLVALRRRSIDAEDRVKSAEDAASQKAAFQRELQRQSVQLEALRDQFMEAQLKVEKLSSALRDFHAPAVSSIQMATVYSESLAASLAMNESDRGDAQELKQCVEQLRQTMQKLTAKLAELGVPHS